jgi:hypothetical protein
MKQELSLDTPATYQIIVQGYLEAHWSDWFEGMDILPKVNEENNHVTRLIGIVIDQAALHGVLRKLYDLGMPLLSVSCIDQKQE